jgi:hypothetical protein
MRHQCYSLQRKLSAFYNEVYARVILGHVMTIAEGSTHHHGGAIVLEPNGQCGDGMVGHATRDELPSAGRSGVRPCDEQQHPRGADPVRTAILEQR